MKCKDIKLLMMDALYGELPGDSEKTFREHLKQCENCRSEFKKLTVTSETLREWTDEEPAVSLSFVTESRSIPDRILEKLTPKKIIYGFSFSLSFILLFLALLNSGISYRDGELNFYIGFGKQKQTVSDNNYLTRSEFEQFKLDNLKLVSSLIASNNEQQKKENLVLLEQLYRKFEQQRQADLQYVTGELKSLRYGTASRLNQTDQILNNLIRYASMKK